jgi:glutathione S-transferase
MGSCSRSRTPSWPTWRAARACCPTTARRWALVFQWLFFEQYSHEPYIATSRFWRLHKPDGAERTAVLAARRDGGWAALRVMEGHLAARAFFVEDYSIADIALFAYTHVAHEGGFPLDDLPHVRGWLARVQAQPGFVAMEHH